MASATEASRALEHLLLQRLAPNNECSLLERGVITYVWIETSCPGVADGVDPLISIMKSLSDNWGTRLTPEATHASLIVSA